MSRKKPRHLSSEERALWDRVKVTAKPLRGTGAAIAPPVVEAPPLPTKAAAPRAKMPLLPVIRPPGKPTIVLPKPAVTRLDGSRLEKLRRGKLKPEARLDLHGMTVDRAYSALSHFMHQSHAGGLRLVLVITGKGSPVDTWDHGGREYGILRQSVPRWLSLPPMSQMVLGTHAAHRRHGGEGALYVYLRRHR